MPHIVVTHSADPGFDIQPLLQALHNDLARHESVEPAQIKTYALPLAHWIVGRNDCTYNMIHVEIKMKPGRDTKTRKEMAAGTHDILRASTEKTGIPYAISVEIHELDEVTYHSSYTKGQ